LLAHVYAHEINGLRDRIVRDATQISASRSMTNDRSQSRLVAARPWHGKHVTQPKVL
jgi:hypothetical protein